MTESRHQLIAGVDEAGRGALAGPIVAAAVILDPRSPVEGIRDSKTVSPSKREELLFRIVENCLGWSVGIASNEEVDRLNVLRTTLLAMKRAIERLSPVPNLILIDGTSVPQVKIRAEAVIDGDSRFPPISAASIVAKVIRDWIMESLGEFYAPYGFRNNKGYPTQKHKDELNRWGPSVVHRMTYAPVREVLARTPGIIYPYVYP